MLSDPIADMLARIRNAYLVHKEQVVVPFSKTNHQILKILVKEGYLTEVKKQKIKIKNKEREYLVCQLKYYQRKPAVNKIIRVSKPSLRVYSKSKNLKPVLGGYGIAIISTSKGIMTDKEARKNKLGGEIICKVW